VIACACETKGVFYEISLWYPVYYHALQQCLSFVLCLPRSAPMCSVWEESGFFDDSDNGNTQQMKISCDPGGLTAP